MDREPASPVIKSAEGSWSELMRRLRHRRRLTRPDVARAAQLSTSAVKAYESGTRRPKLTTAGRLLRSLEASEQEILVIAEALGYHPHSLLSEMRAHR